MANRLATPEEVAEWLQVPVERLHKLRRAKRGPRAIVEGRMIRYAWADVHSWVLSSRTVSHDG
ncbi:helix-turn-helix domain-containing protein [Microterricola viridarii]|uniref:helix-turn-helix domain-containing protein n=1 Tax=Microterricola viridarii TaxID=412690 RepID=UPI00190123F8|nr:helix-turn-helix domain-containing protein [Microterricola viridarii]